MCVKKNRNGAIPNVTLTYLAIVPSAANLIQNRIATISMKLNDKHFKIFKAACLEWIKFWNLDDWNIEISQGTAEKGNEADTELGLYSRFARISLAKEWQRLAITTANLRQTAKHEVLHIVLAPIACLLDKERKVTADEYIGAEHAVLMKIMSKLRS